MLVSEEHQRLKLLQQKRIGRFISDASTLDYLAEMHDLDSSEWHRKFLRFVPLFLAVRQDTNNPPETFRHITQLTDRCARNSMQLTEKRYALLAKAAAGAGGYGHALFEKSRRHTTHGAPAE